MTTPIKTSSGINLWELTNYSLVEEYADYQNDLARVQKTLGHLEQEIHARLDAASATALTDDDGVILVKRTPRTPDYDQGLLVALKEALTAEAYGESWVEGGIKETFVAARWDMRQVLKWARTLGKPVQDILDRARLPGKPGNLEFAEAPAADAG